MEIQFLLSKVLETIPKMKTERFGGQPKRSVFPVWVLTGFACDSLKSSCRSKSQNGENPFKSTVFTTQKIFVSLLTRRDDLGRVVIPKEIRRTMRIREGDPSLTTLTQLEKYCFAILGLAERRGW